MPSPKAQKINLHTEYPCPYCRRGCLHPIALTEALGCDRCQQIFVIEENGLVIEQLSTSYPYKRSWYWTGKSWRLNDSSGWGQVHFSVYLLVILLLVILLLPAAFDLASGWRVFLAMLGLAVVILIMLMVWLAYRR